MSEPVYTTFNISVDQQLAPADKLIQICKQSAAILEVDLLLIRVDDGAGTSQFRKLKKVAGQIPKGQFDSASLGEGWSEGSRGSDPDDMSRR